MKPTIFKDFVVSVAVLAMTMLSVSAGATTINFDTFPDNTPVPTGTIITNQYLSVGASFSSTFGGAVTWTSPESSSQPNILCGNPSSFDPIVIDFAETVSSVDVTLISVGNATVTATAYDSSLSTVLATLAVTNPGTGVGLNNKDTITLSGAGISRVQFAITQPFAGDGFGIDDVRFSASSPVPEPSTFLLVASGLAGAALLRRRVRK